MAKKKTETAVVVTRAEKKDATKNLIRDELTKKQYKHNDLIEEAAKAYTQKFGGEETENINDVKGRVGSVLDIMKKDGDVVLDGGVYALKQENPAPVEQKEPPKKKPVKKTAKKETETIAQTDEKTEEKPAEKPVKKAAKKSAKSLKTKEETVAEPEVKEAETTEKPQEPVSKKRPRKAKKETVKEETTEETVNEPTMVEVTEEKPAEMVPVVEVNEELVVKEKAEIAPKNVVMDMSFLFGDVKLKQQEQKTEEKPMPAPEKAELPKTEEKPQEKQEEKKSERINERKGKPIPPVKPVEQNNAQPTQNLKKPLKVQGSALSVRRKESGKPMTEEEKLRESFLRRLRALGGDYFEYYSVYLLEKYSRRNGRRLEALRVSGGERDGGVDGEIELTDKFGFRETIYIQSKNWDPDKGDEKMWVVGETLLQQFIGACMCRQKKDGKQHSRGIFITTSRFTPEAKRLLEEMSDTIIGYDGAELFETAKECSFGLICKNGTWQLDEQLLSGTKAFFNML